MHSNKSVLEQLIVKKINLSLTKDIRVLLIAFYLVVKEIIVIHSLHYSVMCVKGKEKPVLKAVLAVVRAMIVVFESTLRLMERKWWTSVITSPRAVRTRLKYVTQSGEIIRLRTTAKVCVAKLTTVMMTSVTKDAVWEFHTLILLLPSSCWLLFIIKPKWLCLIVNNYIFDHYCWSIQQRSAICTCL